MRPDVPKWLEDVRDAAQYILSATQGKTFEAFSSDRTMRQAVERSFEVIGEAVNRIARTDESVAARLTDRRRVPWPSAAPPCIAESYEATSLKLVIPCLDRGRGSAQA